jgi:hypothetical protein
MLHPRLRYVTFSALTLNLRLCNVTLTSLLCYILVEVTLHTHYIFVSTMLPLHLRYIIIHSSLLHYIFVSD